MAAVVAQVDKGVRWPIPWSVFVVAFSAGTVAALLILPFGLESYWAGPTALVFGTLAAGLAAHLGSERSGGRLPVVLAYAFGAMALALPLALLVYLGLGTTPLTLALVVFRAGLRSLSPGTG